MKLFTLIAIAATATAVTLAPAAAKSKKHYRAPGYGGGYGPGWRSRAVSDPSIGHPSSAAVSSYTGRCVEDLGYGRYEYCGW